MGSPGSHGSDQWIASDQLRLHIAEPQEAPSSARFLKSKSNSPRRLKAPMPPGPPPPTVQESMDYLRSLHTSPTTPPSVYHLPNGEMVLSDTGQIVKESLNSGVRRSPNPEPSEKREKMRVSHLSQNKGNPNEQARGLEEMAVRDSFNQVELCSGTREELLTMGYMKLKKWLVAHGCNAKELSKCLTYDQVLKVAEDYGFLDVPKPGKEPNQYFGTYDTILEANSKKDEFFCVRVDRRHPSNQMSAPMQMPVKAIEAHNAGYRHTNTYTAAFHI